MPLYGSLRQGRNRVDRYRCQACGYAIGMDELEQWAQMAVLGAIGSRPLPRKVVTPAIDHPADLHRTETQIAEIESAVTSGELPLASATRMLSWLDSDRERLAALPQREKQISYVPLEDCQHEFTRPDNPGSLLPRIHG